MNTLAVIGAGALIFVGAMWAAIAFARKYEREKIRRWLAEQAVKRSRDSIEAHEDAAEKGRKEYL